MATEAGSVVVKIKGDSTSLNKSLAETKTKLQGVGAQAKKAGTGFKQFAKSFIGITAAVMILRKLGGVLKSTIKKSNDFQISMANVSTLVDTAKVSTRAMSAEILALDSRLGNAKELTDALYQALSAGVPAAKAVKFVGEAAKFAKAGLTDAFTAVDVLTTAINAYGLEANKATHISDILFQTIKLGKTTGQELGSSLGNIIPTAAQLGVGMEEIGAAMVAFTKQGVTTVKATTQLRALMSSFIKPSEEMAKALEEAGHASGSALIETEGLTGAIKFLNEASEGNKEVLSELLPNKKAISGMYALMGQGAIEYADALESMNDVTGETQKAFEKQRLTFDTLRNEVDKTAILLGQTFMPVLDELAKKTTSAFKGINDFLQDTEKMSKSKAIVNIAKNLVIGNFAALGFDYALGIVGKTISRIVSIGFDGLVKGIKIVADTFTAFGGIVIDVGKLLANVIGLVLDPFNAEKRKKVTKSLDNLTDGFKKLTVDAAKEFMALGKAVKAGVTDSLDDAGKEFKKLGKAVFEDMRGIRTNMGGILDDLSPDLSEVDKFVVGFIERMSSIGKKTKPSLDGFKAGFVQTFTDMVALTQEAFAGIAGIMDNFFEYQNEVIENQKIKEIESLQDKLAQELEIRGIAEETETERLEREIAEATLAGDVEKAELLKKEAERLRITTDFEKKIEDVERNAAKKKHKIAVDQFNAQKALDITSAAIGLATGIVSIWSGAFSTVPFPPAAAIMAGIFTGILSTIAGIQIGVIASKQPPPAPTFATGGIVPGNQYTGDNVAVQADSGEMFLTRQQQSNLFNSISSGSLGGGQTINLVVDGSLLKQWFIQNSNKELRLSHG